MKIYLAGSGKLAQEIFSINTLDISLKIEPWSNCNKKDNAKVTLIHTGSGRELDECYTYCDTTKSTLIELATGTISEKHSSGFPLIICPNISILMLKTMNMLQQFGKQFQEYNVSIEESHQASKKSVAGTAVQLAKSFNISPHTISSIRDSEKQLHELSIPREHLDAHAYHKIRITNSSTQIEITTKVLGHESYSDGIIKLLYALQNKTLENRTYNILELIHSGWL